VFDEADRLFEMGFAEQLKAILGLLPASRQIALFSATLPSSLSEFVSAGLRSDAVYVRLDNEMKLSPDLGCEFLAIKSEYRVAGLLSLLEHIYHAGTGKLTIVFTATKHHVEYLQELLSSLDFKSVGVYGSLDQEARVQAVESFRSGKCPILVVTDLAARGLDIPLLDNVINYDMPATCKLFIHRVGRAARAGRSGTAFSLCTSDELPYYIDLKIYLNIRPELCAYPQDLLDIQASRISGQHSLTSNNLEYKWKVLNNAYKRYYASRPAASQDGYTQAKLIQTNTLPFAAKFSSGGSSVKEAEQLKAAIHNYKPKGRLALSSVNSKSAPKRQEAKQHADKEFYLSYQPMNSVNEDRIYSLQNSADHFLSEDPLERRSSSKNFANTSKKRSGDLAEKYEQWRKKTHVSLPKVGEPELPERLQSALASKKKRWYGKK
jgi:ATP-dependent RNA helicase DDX54/DBP10